MPATFVERIPRDVVRVGPLLRASCIKALANPQMSEEEKNDLVSQEAEIFAMRGTNPSLYLLAMSKCEKWKSDEKLQLAIDDSFNKGPREAVQKLADTAYVPKIIVSAVATPRCPDCHRYMSMITAEQKRSADEGMTAKFMCLKCEEEKKLILSGLPKVKDPGKLSS